ncbi:hypothetical protein D0Y65_019359 [Glycine soja]|uniref:Uncharacterized protein n=1 Tax=Glycine soja TaxID=3848 RepID=A0A445J8W2_GLYSO|nr:hypothetical protein D0Y65_019359 [Glycine soja]
MLKPMSQAKDEFGFAACDRPNTAFLCYNISRTVSTDALRYLVFGCCFLLVASAVLWKDVLSVNWRDVSVPTMWFNANSMSASMVCFGRSQILIG